MNQITLTAVVRSEQGSGAAGRLRRAGKIPAIVKRATGEQTLITLDAHEYEMSMRKQTATSEIALDLAGAQISVTIYEVQHDVITGEVTHVDFGEISK
ncbi:MAG: hypothetical protein IJV69_01505 [Kiritimatiellae bacterium]|nr:hypothetical protein [Kiritimatiellia bacterium]